MSFAHARRLLTLLLVTLPGVAGCKSEAPPEPAAQDRAAAATPNAAPIAAAPAADAPEAPNSEDPAPHAAVGPHDHGLTGAPETHRLELTKNVRPNLTPEVRARLTASLEQRLSRSVDGLERTRLGPASEGIDPRGRFQHVVVQVRGEDGTLRTECVESRRQLDGLLRGTGSP